MSTEHQRHSQRPWYARVAAGLFLILSAIGGAMIGAKAGASLCNDPPDTWFRCMGEFQAGLFVGFFVGGAIGVAGAVLVARLLR